MCRGSSSSVGGTAAAASVFLLSSNKKAGVEDGQKVPEMLGTVCVVDLSSDEEMVGSRSSGSSRRQG